MKLKILILGILAVASISSLAQTLEIEYDYDEAGNRTQREYKVIPPPETAIMENEENNNKSGEKTSNETEVSDQKDPEVYQDLLAETQFNIYPNPTRGKLKIDILNYQSNVEGGIQVFDMSGRLVQNVNQLNSSMDIDITNEPPGSYIMIIVIGNEKSEWKIIKQ